MVTVADIAVLQVGLEIDERRIEERKRALAIVIEMLREQECKEIKPNFDPISNV